jgi:hypothetical protein
MRNNSQSKNNFLPNEYRKTAENLFPKDGFFKAHKPEVKAASEFAKALGIGVEYQRLLALDKNSDELRTFLEHFQNNLDLLIQKTWVEKAEERRKEKLQNEVPSLMTTIEKGDLSAAIEEFNMILEELSYLFFGSQSEKEDFTEYTFRIDAQMGLFWWYGNKLFSLKDFGSKNGTKDEKVLWAVLLLGICYLTNF